MADRLTHWLDT